MQEVRTNKEKYENGIIQCHKNHKSAPQWGVGDQVSIKYVTASKVSKPHGRLPCIILQKRNHTYKLQSEFGIIKGWQPAKIIRTLNDSIPTGITAEMTRKEITLELATFLKYGEEATRVSIDIIS